MKTTGTFSIYGCQKYTKPLRVFALLGYFVLASALKLSGQGISISGKVTDAADGHALPGVNIVVKGTSIGTASDTEGKYSLSLNDGSNILIFSFVGFETTEISVDQRSIVDIELVGSVKQLSEVVVTALGYEVERDKVGSASTQVSGQTITKSGEPTLINGLSGKSSGLIINRTTGDPGSGSYIQIRGQSSITTSIQPLIVVDGVPVYNTNWGAGNNAGIAEQSRLNDINPSDIESIEVLKGASASALWGTRGGNGVIVITTKKGKSSAKKVNITYSGTYSLDEILTKHPMQTTYGQGTLGAYRTDVLTSGGYRDSYGDKISDRPGGPDSVFLDQGYFVTSDGKTVYPIVENGGKRSRQTFDPYDAVFGRGHYYDQTLSISGGDNDGNYYISIGDLDQKGIIKERSTYRRTSFRINTEKQMNDWLRLGSSFMYSRLKQQGVIFGNAVTAAMVGVLRSPPDWDNAQGYDGIYYAPNGTPFVNRQLAYRNQIGRNPSPIYDNPVWSMNNDRQTRETDRFIASLQIQASPLDWLSLRVRAGVDQYTENRIGFFLPGGVAGNPPGSGSGTLAIGTTREAQFNIDAFAQGRFEFSSDLKAGFLLGVNANQRTMDDVGGSISSLIITSPPPFSLDNSTTNFDDPFNGYNKVRASALYATADLEFKDQLFLTLTGRAENSSVFSHSNNPTFFYPSATVNWHVLKALNLKMAALTFAKVRAGYGVVSTIPGPYNTITYWNPATVGDGYTGLNASSTLYGGGYQQSTTQGNKDLKPETKSEVEAGLDLRFLKDRISFSGTYFSNIVRDAIIPAAMAPSTGFTSRTGNVAEITNSGVEIDFSGEVLRAGNFSWKVFGNWTRIRNKITSLGQDSVVNFAAQGFTAVVGHPVGIHYGTPFMREGKDLLLDTLGFPQTALTASVVGDPNPEWRLGAGTSLSWKNLSLSVLFEHSHGGQIHGQTRGAMVTMGTHKDTEREVTLTPAEAATIRNKAGKTADTYGYKPNSDGSYTVRGYLHDFGGGQVLIDQAWWGGLGGGFNTPNIESYIEPAQWTKLREFSLSYSMKSPAFQRQTKLTSIDITVTGRNLLLWTEFKGNDPETNTRGPSNVQGRDYFTNPATRSLLFTIIINY